MSKAIELLQKLVQIPSVNPRGQDEGWDHPKSIYGETRIAKWLGDYLEGAGFDVALIEVAPGRPNLVASYGLATADNPAVCLCSHLDVVRSAV